MDFLKTLVDAVASSEGTDEQTRRLLCDFLTQQEPLLREAGAAATQAVLAALAEKKADQAYDALLAALGEAELLSLLRKIGPAMEQAAAQREKTVQHYRSLAEQLGEAALEWAGRLLMASL